MAAEETRPRVPLAFSKSDLVWAIQFTQGKFRDGLEKTFILDMAFIGNTGDVYRWQPALIIDIDICLLVKQRDKRVGMWLLDTGRTIARALEEKNMNFELRIIRGPYKPTPEIVTRPEVLAHVAVFVEGNSNLQPGTFPWALRKYKCLKEPDRFAKFPYSKPNPGELLKVIQRKLSRIQNGIMRMDEWRLPNFNRVDLEFTADEPIFAEYCFNAGACCARNHARVLNKKEADSLENETFFPWYNENVFPSPALLDLMALKRKARNHGFAGMTPKARRLAGIYLKSLYEHIAGEKFASFPYRRTPGQTKKCVNQNQI
jgi:hypothetical protein